jgi:alpha-L-fucosidase
MTQNKRPLGYLGGDIMSFGSNLARQYEYDKFIEMGLPVDVYSPVQNKSINDKSNMTEEENNGLAEKITTADIERLWNSDFVVIEPAQSAIGTLCELGCLFGWKYMCDRLLEIVEKEDPQAVINEIERMSKKDVYCHYFDIRTNHLNEKDWRRSFSINQLLYGMILYVEKNGDIETFDEIMEQLNKKYGGNK